MANWPSSPKYDVAISFLSADLRVRDAPQHAVWPDDSAHEVDRHPAHVARTFRARYGCTIGEVVQLSLTGSQCSDGGGPTANLSEIALRAGFHDQAPMTRIFRRITKDPPAAFRKRKGCTSEKPVSPLVSIYEVRSPDRSHGLETRCIRR